MILLLGLLCLIGVEPAWSLKENEEFSFEEDIQQVAVGTNNIYVTTAKTLHQLWKWNDVQRVPANSPFTSNFSINVLLPFVKNSTLISCSRTDQTLCGYCEIRDLKIISKILYRKHIQVGPQRSSRGSVSFLVDVKEDSGQTETYILTAIQNHTDKTEDRCRSDIKIINLHNTDQTQNGGLFSRFDQSGSRSPGIQTEANVEFVDGFQINSTVYLFSNVASGDKTNKVRLIWLQAETNKTQTMKSLRGATLSSSGGEGSRLLASSVAPGGQQVLWSGVFSLDGGEANTELLLFDISPDPGKTTYRDPDFYTSMDKPNNPSEPKSLKPKVVLFKKKYMSSVLAMRQDSWTVFFIGTTSGQLIKLAVDKNNVPGCSKELYRASGNQKIFPKIHLDPVDHKHVYLPFKTKIKHLPVSNCKKYYDVKDCCTAQDPHCVWCVSKQSCIYKDDCKVEWLSIPGESKQGVVSHRAVKDSTGEVKVIVQVHLTVAQRLQSNFACQIFTTSGQLCRLDGPQPQYPQCTCILSDALLAIELDVTVRITFAKEMLTEQLKLIDCSISSLSCQQCIRAGCEWRQNRCSWNSEGVQNDSVCINTSPENVLRPEITSISPRLVSIFGRNHALLTGRNLNDVIGVKIQAEMGCPSQESPVWNNTGESLTFHIPSRANEAEAKVCAVLSDGSCHGEAEIVYQSAPSCSSFSPSTSWRSGKRKITLSGSYLDTVEMVSHRSYFQQHEAHLEHINSMTLTYKTPVGKTSHYKVHLKVGNETSYCSKDIIYYPDPRFPTFISRRTGNEVQVTIQSTDWGLNMTTEELSAWGVKDGKQYPCIMKGKNNTNTEANYFICEIQNTTGIKFSQLTIKYGQMTVQVGNPSLCDQYLLILRLLLVPCVTAVLVIICQCLAMKNNP